MKTCAFLSMESLEGFFSYDQLLMEPLAERGWEVRFVPWRAATDWSGFDVVVIRTPWDYYLDPEAFIAVLETIDAQTRLENPLETVRWNMDKRYLLDLQERGIAIPPTLVVESATPMTEIRERIASWRTDEIVMKPLVSANAANTHRLPMRTTEEGRTLARHVESGTWLVQPFIKSVVTEGELSLFYFGGSFSHAISKVPAIGDYRVQEEHGGQLRSIDPDEKVRRAADEVVSAIGRDLLYARVDLVRHEDRWLLMELEVIEPSLYFNMDPESPERFARVFAEWFS